ncbi:hypothetical protein GE09DRAFT_1089519 [Coniochaeta sp. 2T2.1]|nr:hypothetical protein GE09DRAFT_1089519 [Coniochaeta sp. 2T2.1]
MVTLKFSRRTSPLASFLFFNHPLRANVPQLPYQQYPKTLYFVILANQTPTLYFRLILVIFIISTKSSRQTDTPTANRLPKPFASRSSSQGE